MKFERTIGSIFESTCLTGYPRPIEITYNQGSKFIGHEFRKYLIEKEYGILAKPISSGNQISKIILKIIHLVLGILVRAFNIKDIYIDEDDPWLGLSEAAVFEIFST